MEKQLKCVLLLSLKEISLRRVAVLLWSGSDILASISKVSVYRDSTFEKGDKWRRALDDKMKDKMLTLDIPESLTNEMIELVGPMSLEVRTWKYSQQDLIWPLSNAIDLPDSAKLCWTTAGTINYRKTAEELFCCDKLAVLQRYKIACYYCLEDRISLYWEELHDRKTDTYDDHINFLSDLTYYWSCILKGEHSKLDNLAYNRNRTSFNQFAFEHSANEGLKTAAEYFFQKLSREERDASLMRTAHAVMANCTKYEDTVLSNLLFYFLSLMTPEQQMEIIKAHPIDVFLCFLRSQLQGLFRENASLLWALFPPSTYIALLMKIFYANRIYFPKMIRELFKECPLDFKTCFVEETSRFLNYSPADDFLLTFLKYNDPESIKEIFRNVDAASRKKYWKQRNFGLFYDYMKKDEWHLVELCLREATLSEEEKGKLKDDYTLYLEVWGRGDSKLPVFKRFFEFLETDAKKGQKHKLANCSSE